MHLGPLLTCTTAPTVLWVKGAAWYVILIIFFSFFPKKSDWGFHVEFARSPRVRVLSRFSSFIPQFKDMQLIWVRLTDD